MARLKNKYCFLFVVLNCLVLSLMVYKEDVVWILTVVQFKMGYYRLSITGTQYGHIYILSAVAKLGSFSSGYSGIVLNVWDDSINTKFYCCIQISSEYSIARAMQTSYYGKQTSAVASQYFCKMPLESNASCQVGIIPMDATLHQPQQEMTHKCKNITYTKVYFPQRNEGKLGLCTKIAYSRLNPAHLVEWFEYQRMMGVDKVITAIQEINQEALRVFKHYEKEGILETIEYPLNIPGDYHVIKDRGFEVERRVFPQFSHDEQVSVYHCKERLQGYQYAAVVDFDEYIVSSKNQTTLELIMDLRRQYPKAASFTFYTTFFFTNKSMPENTVLTTTYLQTVGPRWECYKNIYIPARVKTVATHTIEPLDNYDRQIVPHNTAVLHHYRECIGGKKWKDCSQSKKPEYIMLRHEKEIHSRINTQNKIMNIQQ